jgi:hypothetical protein
MRTKEHIMRIGFMSGRFLDVKSILHVPGRMISRKIEHGEDVIIILDLGPF